MKKEKRYSVSYTSDATGYGWEIQTDDIEEVRDIVNSESFGRNYTAYVTVWDNVLHDFIFWKRCLDYKPEIDRMPDKIDDEVKDWVSGIVEDNGHYMTPEEISLEDAEYNLKQYKADGEDIPLGVTSAVFMEAWNDEVKLWRERNKTV